MEAMRREGCGEKGLFVFGWGWAGSTDAFLPSQYPVRPASMTYDDIPHLSARIKPKQQKVGCPLCWKEGWGGAGGAEDGPVGDGELRSAWRVRRREACRALKTEEGRQL